MKDPHSENLAKEIRQDAIHAVHELRKQLDAIERCIELDGFPVYLDDAEMLMRRIGRLASQHAMLENLAARRLQAKRRPKQA